MKNEFEKILVDINKTVKDALKLLDSNEEKILFVVDHSRKLIGSLTDGDIRRWILKDGDINSNVGNVCYKDTYYVTGDYNEENVKKEILSRDIAFVPVLDAHKKIIDILVWDVLFEEKKILRTKQKLEIPVVIMAGGRGTRLDPFTRVLPKPLLPIGEKTILEIIIDKFQEYTINNYYLSVNHKAKIIKSYFEELQPEYKITYLYEQKPLGTIGALKQLEGIVESNILLTNCDIIIETDYSELVKHHIDSKNDITIVASLKHFNIPYGVCEIETGGNLLILKEKPEFDFWVNTGMYIIKSNLLEYIPRDELFHVTHLIEKAKGLNKKVGIYPISENSWLDTGEWIEYNKAAEKLKHG